MKFLIWSFKFKFCRKKSYKEYPKDDNIDLTRIFNNMEPLDLTKDIWDFSKLERNIGWPSYYYFNINGSLIIFTQGSVLAPFIYSIF